MSWWQWVVLALAILAVLGVLLWVEDWLNRRDRNAAARAGWEAEQREARWQRRGTDE